VWQQHNGSCCELQRQHQATVAAASDAAMLQHPSIAANECLHQGIGLQAKKQSTCATLAFAFHITMRCHGKHSMPHVMSPSSSMQSEQVFLHMHLLLEKKQML